MGTNSISSFKRLLKMALEVRKPQKSYNIIGGTKSVNNICRCPNVIPKQDQTTKPETPCPTFCNNCVGYLTSPAHHNGEDAGEGPHGLSLLYEKARFLSIC